MTKLKQRTVEDGRRILSGWEKSGLSQEKGLGSGMDKCHFRG